MGFSKNLKRLRVAKKISVADISKRIGIAENTYRNYENENRNIWPAEDTLKRIAHALNVSLDELIGYRKAKVNEEQPQVYCKQLSLKCESDQDSYVITAKKSILPQGKKVIINKSDFVDIKQETKEKTAPFITEIEAAVFMILAYCKQNSNDLIKETAINNINNIVFKSMYSENNYAADAKRTLKLLEEIYKEKMKQWEKKVKEQIKLRDDIIKQQKKVISTKQEAYDSLKKYADQLSKGILSKHVSKEEGMQKLLDENYTLKLYIINQAWLKKMEETGKTTLTADELEELRKTYPW